VTDPTEQVAKAMHCPSCGHVQVPENFGGEWRLPEHKFDSDGICPFSNLSLDMIEDLMG
jgi:hypothetical protein